MIETRRLRLVSLGPAVLRASLAGRREESEKLLAASLPGDWPDTQDLRHVLVMRLADLRARPDNEPWLSRVVTLRDDARVVGLTGFHGPPGGEWLCDFAPEGVEFGYSIFEPDRRQGFAFEASEALIAWASAEHRVRDFVLSIAPDNVPSARLAAKLGFQRVGHWHHAVRGLEHVHRRTLD